MITVDPVRASVLRKDREVAEVLATRGLTLETEWQLYGIIGGMIAAGVQQGKNQAVLYATNTGFRNAMDMVTAITTIRSAP